jgi:hypothetical protein
VRAARDSLATRAQDRPRRSAHAAFLREFVTSDYF